MHNAHTRTPAEAGHGVLEISTRAGVRLPFQRSGAACLRARRICGDDETIPLRGGDRVRLPRGEATIAGAYRDRIWFVVDAFADQGA